MLINWCIIMEFGKHRFVLKLCQSWLAMIEWLLTWTYSCKQGSCIWWKMYWQWLSLESQHGPPRSEANHLVAISRFYRDHIMWFSLCNCTGHYTHTHPRMCIYCICKCCIHIHVLQAHAHAHIYMYFYMNMYMLIFVHVTEMQDPEAKMDPFPDKSLQGFQVADPKTLQQRLCVQQPQ